MNQNLSPLKYNKENNCPNSDYQNNEKDNLALEFEIKNQLRKTYMPKAHYILNGDLDKIYENDEQENYNSNNKEFKDDFEINQNPRETINNLKRKIKELENQIINLRKKNEILIKDNIENDSRLKRMSYIGTRSRFTFGIKNENNKI